MQYILLAPGFLITMLLLWIFKPKFYAEGGLVAVYGGSVVFSIAFYVLCLVAMLIYFA